MKIRAGQIWKHTCTQETVFKIVDDQYAELISSTAEKNQDRIGDEFTYQADWVIDNCELMSDDT